MAHDNQVRDEDQNLLTNDAGEKRKQHLAKLTLVLVPWFAKWSDSFPSHVIGKVQMATYVEALYDLTEEELEIGCREATKVATEFPKPGHIRKALRLSRNEMRCTRPAYLDEPPPMTLAEREAELSTPEYQEMRRKAMGR